MRKFFLTAIVAGLMLAALRPIASRAADETSNIRLYAFDGGHIEIADMGMFSDTGEGAGKPGRVIASSFLIRHPKGDLLWDTGLGDAIAAHKEGVSPGPGFRSTVHPEEHARPADRATRRRRLRRAAEVSAISAMTYWA